MLITIIKFNYYYTLIFPIKKKINHHRINNFISIMNILMARRVFLDNIFHEMS